jgi:hypothetical protein
MHGLHLLLREGTWWAIVHVYEPQGAFRLLPCSGQASLLHTPRCVGVGVGV